MSIQNIQAYLEANYHHFRESVSAIAQSNNPETNALQSDKQMYNFDKISQSIHSRGKKFCSADALRIHRNAIELIEFKSGFKRQITKRSWDREKARCDYRDDVCDEYWELFWKLEKKERQILIDSIKDKAVESYVTLEKHILPQQETREPIHLRYIAVIDSDDVESYEDTLSDLSGGTANANNASQQVRRSLVRLLGCQDCGRCSYYYDEILVCTFHEFDSCLKHEQ